MIDPADWRKSAQHHFLHGMRDLIAGLEASADDLEGRRREWVAQAEENRRRAKIPSHVPLDVSEYYLRLREKKLPSAGPLGKLIKADALKKTWERAQNNSYFGLSFAIDAIDAAEVATSFKKSPSNKRFTYHRMTKNEQRKHCETIANSAKALAAAVLNSPGAWNSVFQYLDDDTATRIANHAMVSPAEVVALIPRTAQDAIEMALGLEPSMFAALNRLAEVAEGWRTRANGAGRRDDNQHIRLFVRKLYTRAADGSGLQQKALLPIVGKACVVLMDGALNAAQLRDCVRE